jgi:hypothetical protein
MVMVKRSAVAKATAVGVLAVLVIAGAVGIYYYTSAPVSTQSTTGSSTVGGNTSTSTQTGASTLGSGPAGGSCQKNAAGQCTQPEGAWADYLGYIPSGYTLAPHFPNAPDYPCPSGMDATQCATFQQSCGNGVCDPNESCASCPIDCGINGQLTCDPYTGRPGAPVSVCQVGEVE